MVLTRVVQQELGRITALVGQNFDSHRVCLGYIHHPFADWPATHGQVTIAVLLLQSTDHTILNVYISIDKILLIWLHSNTVLVRFIDLLRRWVYYRFCKRKSFHFKSNPRSELAFPYSTGIFISTKAHNSVYICKLRSLLSVKHEITANKAIHDCISQAIIQYTKDRFLCYSFLWVIGLTEEKLECSCKTTKRENIWLIWTMCLRRNGDY